MISGLQTLGIVGVVGLVSAIGILIVAPVIVQVWDFLSRIEWEPDTSIVTKLKVSGEYIYTRTDYGGIKDIAIKFVIAWTAGLIGLYLLVAGLLATFEVAL